MAVLAIGVMPLSLRVNEQKEVVERLSLKSEMVPVLRNQLAQIKRSQHQRDEQLSRLLDLVAGTSELTTLLAELNNLANSYQVSIVTTEPGDVQRFIPPIPATQVGDEAPPAAGGGELNASSQDALLNRGLEKRSAALSVTGTFQQVFAFLQALEQLETFVVTSDLDVTVQAQADRPDDETVMPKVAMSFQLTAYGRQASEQTDSDMVEEQR